MPQFVNLLFLSEALWPLPCGSSGYIAKALLNQKSQFCNVKTAIQQLDKIASKGKYKILLLSYNSEGIIEQENIFVTLEKYGKVELVEFEHLCFKSNNNGNNKTKKFVYEQLYILKKHL